MTAQALTPAEIDSLETDDLSPAMGSPPDDVKHLDGVLTAWDGVELYWQSWEPTDASPRAVVCLMHGYAEHSARYHHLASLFVRAGYAVIAIDARGHGRSAGTRGHVDEFDEFPRDLDRVISEAETRWLDVPAVVFGHSNGGFIALHHALMCPGRARAYAVTSPFCGFQVKVPLPKALAGRAMSKVWPTFSLPTELDASLVSHLDHVVEKYAEDPLRLDVATARWFTETKAAQARLLAEASRIKAPFLFLVAGDDQVVDASVAEEVYHRLGSAEREFELLPDLYHEVMNEAGWADLGRQVVDWYERYI